MSKAIPEWSKSHPKVMPNRPPSVHSDTKVTSKRPQPVPEWSQIGSTMMHSQPHTPQVASKSVGPNAPIPLLDAQSNAGHSLNWPQSGAKVKSIIEIYTPPHGNKKHGNKKSSVSIQKPAIFTKATTNPSTICEKSVLSTKSSVFDFLRPY